MSSIKIHLEHVRSTNNGLVRQINGLDNIGGGLISLKNSIDHRIKNRQQIEARLTKAVSKGNTIQHELSGLKSFVEISMGKYTNAERRINSHHVSEIAAKTSGKDSKQKKVIEDSIFEFLEKYGNTAVFTQSAIASALILGKQIRIQKKKDHPGRAVIHTAKWIKGKGNNEFLKTLARRMDQTLRDPGMLMKGLKTADSLLEKMTRAQLIGISKAKSFPHFLKTVITGIDDGVHGIATSKIPRMIAKRVYAIDVVFNTAEEGVGVYREHQKGTLDGKDIAVAASNVIIKSSASCRCNHRRHSGCFTRPWWCSSWIIYRWIWWCLARG
ncbi:hypothetical protein LC048_24720 [Mesobacillus subterraneus]|uniref:hypothetical protein n=1 Tax=Mesobacillus subterraneus TaxID=285983 RepID=UPI00273D3B21|nr:hypothetical protein [Mesobacillus subterraneus]WLR55422.1 hypothetical protein LC048_24720 [Mesobacillus subterraneus]